MGWNLLENGDVLAASEAAGFDVMITLSNMMAGSRTQPLWAEPADFTDHRNSAANAAARGSIVQIYATGAGQTQPFGITGAVTASTGTQPLLPVSVTIGGIPATLTYDAEAPGEVSGVFQVNAVVPGGVAPGSAVPVVLTVGSVSSPAAATIAVK